MELGKAHPLNYGYSWIPPPWLLQDLYGLGARRIGVTSLPPFGCLPATITLFGGGSNDCITSLNNDAQNFNQKLTAEVNSLTGQLSGLKMAVFDIYKPFLDLVNNPSKYGTDPTHQELRF